jgi:hypothetical protein
MATTYSVITRDVDGKSTRRFTTLAAAVKRFEIMCGYSVADAIVETYYPNKGISLPELETLNRLNMVSDHGCAVTLIFHRDEADVAHTAADAYLAVRQAAVDAEAAVVEATAAAAAAAAACEVAAAAMMAASNAAAEAQKAGETIYTIRLTGAQRAIVENLMVEAYELACSEPEGTPQAMTTAARYRAHVLNKILMEIGEYATVL